MAVYWVLKMSKMKWWLMFRIYVIYSAGNNSRSIRAHTLVTGHHPYRIHCCCCCCYFLLFVFFNHLFIIIIIFSTLLLISNLNDDVNRNDYPSHAMTVAGTCVSYSFQLSLLRWRVCACISVIAGHYMVECDARAPCSSLTKRTYIATDR